MNWFQLTDFLEIVACCVYIFVQCMFVLLYSTRLVLNVSVNRYHNTRVNITSGSGLQLTDLASLATWIVATEWRLDTLTFRQCTWVQRCNGRGRLLCWASLATFFCDNVKRPRSSAQLRFDKAILPSLQPVSWGCIWSTFAKILPTLDFLN
jgi:hypothetical protein